MESYCVALDALKEGVCGYVGNSLVDWDDRSFVIYPDASKLGCGSVLMRHGLDGSFWIIEIDSRTFNALQRKWQLNTRDSESCTRSCISKFHFGGDGA